METRNISVNNGQRRKALEEKTENRPAPSNVIDKYEGSIVKCLRASTPLMLLFRWAAVNNILSIHFSLSAMYSDYSKNISAPNNARCNISWPSIHQTTGGPALTGGFSTLCKLLLSISGVNMCVCKCERLGLMFTPFSEIPWVVLITSGCVN